MVNYSTNINQTNNNHLPQNNQTNNHHLPQNNQTNNHHLPQNIKKNKDHDRSCKTLVPGRDRHKNVAWLSQLI